MAFAQLTYRNSLRDIEACLRAMGSKLYHAGFRGNVSRSTLAYANETRDWRIYADFAQTLIGIAKPLYANDDFGVQLDEAVYALDAADLPIRHNRFVSVVVSLGEGRCATKFRKSKGAVKLHTLLDLRGNIPTVVIITDGKVHESSSPGESHPQALTEPDVSVSAHPALITQPTASF